GRGGRVGGGGGGGGGTANGGGGDVLSVGTSTDPRRVEVPAVRGGSSPAVGGGGGGVGAGTDGNDNRDPPDEVRPSRRAGSCPWSPSSPSLSNSRNSSSAQIPPGPIRNVPIRIHDLRPGRDPPPPPHFAAEQSHDCLAKAKTGTGKTLAFMIPNVERIRETVHRRRATDVHCLVISPTRDLALQIGSETEKLLSFHPPKLRKAVTCLGGTIKSKDLRSLKGNIPIFVATPGRLLDHLQSTDLAERMANADTLVFDEVDMGFSSGHPAHHEAIGAQSRTEADHPPLRDDPRAGGGDRQDRDATKIRLPTHLHVKQHLTVSWQEELTRDLFAILERETSKKPYKVIVFFSPEAAGVHLRPVPQGDRLLKRIGAKRGVMIFWHYNQEM
ncbi:hypothetical protein ACHAWF_003318, partial [Thalassiosira exigua]